MYSKNKRGAMELSMSTVVVLVLAMLMLGLGIVLVKSIFTVATKSVNTVDSKVQAQLASLFSDESKDLVVLLGPDRTAKISSGTSSFGIGIAARPLEASNSKTSEIKFKVTYENTNPKNCAGVLGQPAVNDFFITQLNQEIRPDQSESNGAFLTVQVNIPKGTPACTQKVYIEAKEPKGTIGTTSFIMEISKAGLFG